MTTVIVAAVSYIAVGVIVSGVFSAVDDVFDNPKPAVLGIVVLFWPPAVLVFVVFAFLYLAGLASHAFGLFLRRLILRG